MDKFIEYVDDKNFVRWVLNPDQELDIYWNNFLLNNPSEKEHIELARMLVAQLQSKKLQNAGGESIDIFSKILQKTENANTKPSFRKIGVTILKYAAVALVFFSLGIAYFYQKNSQFSEISNDLSSVQNQKDVQLILGNGKKLAIAEKKSEIEYETNGNVIINKKDTVQVADNKHEVEMNQLIVPFGKNTSVKLPDGTIAYLNAGSKLVYPSRFDGGKREVFLVGEGFFDVTHNANKPFVVTTGELEVEVLGTKFNVSAYPTDKTIETVLVEGKVKIKETKFNLLNSNYILKPNQQATYYRKSSKTKIRKVDVINYVSWHEGYLNFNSAHLNQIVTKLERYYNIKISMEDSLGVCAITGKLKLNEKTDTVLKVLAKTASVELIKLNQSSYELK